MPVGRRAVAVTAVLALVLVTVGMAVVASVRFSDRGDRAEPPPRNPAARGAADPGLERFYDQDLDWRPCDDDNTCARLEVPLDYDRPSGPTIEVAVLKRDADDPDRRIGSLVVNPGGPGASGTQYADDAGFYFRSRLTRRFDVVGFDPRGVGESAAVDCLSDEELDAYVAGDPDPDTAAEERAFVETSRAMVEGCAERSGRLARHVSTVEAARDMDVLRAVLEEERLTYFGASYGTELGATYAELFPDRVGRMVLDGAVDVSLPSRQRDLEQAAGFETALRAYVADCVETDDACFLGGTVQEGVDRIARLLAETDAAPLPAGGGRELTQGLAFYGIAAPLYNRDYWFYLSAALRDALDGDGRTLALLADSYSTRQPDGDYATNSMEAFVAISCLDDPASATPEEVRADVPAFEEASPTFGRMFAWSTLGCVGQRRGGPELPEIRAEGAAPIVVVGTTRDPATPYTWSEALADQLDSGVLVSRDGDGHTGYNAGNGCVDRAVEDYLVEGTVPDDGLAC